MKVGVIMGGISSEVVISMKTGQEMIANLDSTCHEVVPIIINKREDVIEQVKGLDLDIALLALHGKLGEDGTVQGALEMLGIPYTGSGILSSSLCMNKDISKKLLRYEGIHTPDWLSWDRIEDYDQEAVAQMGYPVIVKPNSGGSSIGIELVRDEQALLAAVQTAFQWDESVMIERYVEGDELTCSILGEELLPHIAIRSVHSEWFDYGAKYEDEGAIEEVVELHPELELKVREAAIGCYRLLKCSVYARIDMIIKDGTPYVLEVNTLPGMTKNSLLPKSAIAAGITFSKLLDQIMMLSLKQRSREQGGLFK